MMSTAAWRAPKGSRAFTLLELLIALAVIAVVACLAIPAFFERSEITLDNASRLLAEDLRAAQNRAAYYAEEVRMVFRADGDGYAVYGADGEPLTSPSGNGDFVRRYSRDGVFEGVRIQSVDAPKRTMRYDDRGRPTTGCQVIVSYGSDARRVEVDASSGLISVPGLARPWVDTGY